MSQHHSDTESLASLDPVQTLFYLGTDAQIIDILQKVAGQVHRSIRCFVDTDECLSEMQSGRCHLLVVEADRFIAHPKIANISVCGGTPVNTLVLVDRGDVEMAVTAIRKGATDCLETSANTEHILLKVKSILNLSELRRFHPAVPLTRTEAQVLQAILEGRTTRVIARNLHRSPRTIEVHRKGIMRKLRATNVVDLVRKAIVLGFLREWPGYHAVRHGIVPDRSTLRHERRNTSCARNS